MESSIAIIRHGITEGNIRRLYYGATDVPLAQEGIDELKKLTADHIYPDAEGALLYTTGLGRTLQSKQLIYGDQPHEIIKDLREINFGTFEMKSYEELMAYEEYRDWINARDESMAPPEGESLRHFKERVIRGFEEVRRRHSQRSLELRHHEQNARSIVICHGGTISAIMEYIWPGEREHMYAWLPDPGHGYLLLLTDDTIRDYESF